MPRRSRPRFFGDDRGATAAEYAIMVAMIVIGAIAAVSLLGGSSSGIWSNDGIRIDAAAAS